jgi:hypothetical protein
MALDLQRILHYGCLDGTVADTRQRKVLTITDGVICGEGEGPLEPTPSPLGLLTMSESTAAAELVHAHLMGLDPERIPIVRESLALSRWSLLDGRASAVRAVVGGQELDPAEAGRLLGRAFRVPSLWQGQCELRRGA